MSKKKNYILLLNPFRVLVGGGVECPCISYRVIHVQPRRGSKMKTMKTT